MSPLEESIPEDPGEIYDPMHLPADEQAIIARIAGVVAREGISIEQAIINEFKTDGDGSNDPDNPITRGLITGHLLSAAFGGSDRVFPDPDGPEESYKGISGVQERELTLYQRRTLFATLRARFIGYPRRFADDIPLAEIEKSLEAATEEDLYGLFMMEKHGHQVGVTREEKAGRPGFRFDSCSEDSPISIREVDYPQALSIARSWGVNLMKPDVFNQLATRLGQLDVHAWSYLYTDDYFQSASLQGYDAYWRFAAWIGDYNSAHKCSKDRHGPHKTGGFRCSLWIPAARGTP